MAVACSSSGGGITPIGAGRQTTASGVVATSTSSSTTTTTTDATKATIIDAYRADQGAFLAVAGRNPVIPTDPRIPAAMTGALLNSVRGRLTAYALEGDYLQGTLEFGATVASVNGTQAIVMDCYFDHTVIVNAKSGQRVGNPADTARTLVQVTMQLGDGTWKMAAVEQKGTGCVAPAA
jgi:hypothetical protein